MSEVAVKHPPVTFKVGDQEIRWTYGLEQDLLRMVGGAEELVDAITSSPFVRDYLVRRALTPLEGFVTKPDEELVKAEAVALTQEQHLDLLDWIAGHLMYFFVQAPSRLMALAKKYQPQVAALSPPSGAGSAT